jgi:hypothetical protein
MRAQPLPILAVFADLPVKLRMVVRIHAALKCLRVIRPIKELRRNTQRADPVAGGPGSANLVSLATHVIIPAQ